ncbi:MAG: zinc transport system substrate-binding protein [Thermosediminibacterales bacterium]|nr:zinc transport system substrate-binding protein [Thermosediminibacterales bacterium]MDK2835357.1 zinc transport system substrate-binding protein [Thermosediminibacterales bacterium]
MILCNNLNIDTDIISDIILDVIANELQLEGRLKMNHTKRLIIGVLFIFIIGLTGCSSNTAEISGKTDKLIAAVSILPQKTFVKAVAGDLIDVVTMIPPGNSPTNYQPSPKEMEDFSKSSVYFTIGVAAEKAYILPKARDLNSNIKIIDLAQEVGKVYPHRYFGNGGERDPHIWLSPKRVKVMIEVIAKELGNLDPKNKEVYRKNAENYIKRLEAVDLEIKQILNEVENRAFIIYHPALGYFAEDYNLQMIPVEKEGKKATPKELQKIIDIAKEKNIKVVFYQEEIDTTQSQTLAEELGGITQKIAPLAPNYIENLKEIAVALKKAMQ